MITVGYWSTKGLGAVTRMVVLYSGNTLKTKSIHRRPHTQCVKKLTTTFPQTQPPRRPDARSFKSTAHWARKAPPLKAIIQRNG